MKTDDIRGCLGDFYLGALTCDDYEKHCLKMIELSKVTEIEKRKAVIDEIRKLANGVLKDNRFSQNRIEASDFIDFINEQIAQKLEVLRWLL